MTKRGMGRNVAEMVTQEYSDEEDDDPTDAHYQTFFAVHTYCSVCGFDWEAHLSQPPSQQGFLECPECRCWSRVNLIDDELKQ